MNLSDIFAAVAHKQLARVDLPRKGSNQHELNGVKGLKDFFRTSEKIKGELQWHYFADDMDSSTENGAFTFYDSREKSVHRTGRSEWRFYYRGEFLDHANIGDWLFLVKTRSAGPILALVFQKNSAWLRAAKSLFGVTQSTLEFDPISERQLAGHDVALLQRQILAELELESLIPTAEKDSELMLRKFGKTFPPAKEVSKFARRQVDVDIAKPDETLVCWLEREEQLFRALEGVIIQERIDQGFEDVDSFIKYSLSVQNRRKSRMGLALQDHLGELFRVKRLKFTAQAKTEASSRPDFIFPGEREYHSAAFSSELLVMLGVKSTSKDRWRQVLTEADRIKSKHLCTLEPGISAKQTNEMARQKLTLVIPQGMHDTYTRAQLSKILSVEDFIEFVRRKQS